MEIKVIKDYRNLKAGTIFNFPDNLTVIVGSNGCGKSSLLQAIRGKLEVTSNDEYSLFVKERKKLANNIEIDFNGKCFSYDVIQDNGKNMDNSFDALAFIHMGGYATKDKSHGESNFYFLDKALSKVKDCKEPSLILLDEPDIGLSLKYQFFLNKLIFNLTNVLKHRVIIATHCLPIIQNQEKVFDFETLEFVDTKEYISSLTNI